MLISFINEPLFYFCLASAVFGIAICISSEDSLIKRQLRLALNQTGKVKMFVPLLTSLGVSFGLTLILRFLG
jgi:hypothetical protein